MTDETTLVRNGDDTFTVIGRGGYDGLVRRNFDSLDEALDYLVSLWAF